MSSTSSSSSSKSVHHLTFLVLNDVYALEPVSDRGGLPQITTLLKRERENSQNAVTSVNGDFLSASAAANKYKGAHMVKIFDAMGVDNVVIGNHEFDYGPEVLSQRMKESKFEWFGTNVLVDGNVIDGAVGTKIQDINGVSVGFFGVCTLMTPRLSFPGDDVEFVDFIETAKVAIKQLQEQGAQVIVAYTHLNNREDKSLARHCPEINLILGGHVHEPYAETEGGTLVMKCGQNAYWLGRVDMRVEIEDDDVRADHSFNFILNMDMEADKDIQALVEDYRVDVSNPDAEVPLYIGSDLESYSGVVRTKESTMGSLVADSMRHMLGTDLAVINGGFIRGDKSYPAGSIFTRADIATELPFESPGCPIQIQGKYILEALEQQIANAPTKNGAFPQLSGFRIEYKESNQPGSRIQACYLCPEHGNSKFRGGRDDSAIKDALKEPDFSSHVPLDPEATYSIAITEFLFGGGDGLTGYTHGEKLQGARDNVLILDLLFEYLTLEDGEMLLSPSLDQHRVWNKD